MIRILALIVPTVLSSCSFVPANQSAVRDTSILLSVTTRGSLEDLSGDWVVRGSIPESASIHSVTLAPRDDGLFNVSFNQSDCSAGCNHLSGTWPAERIAQNRLKLRTDRSGSDEIWVLWMDESMRTAVISSRDGSTALILDRRSTGGQDRIAAARDVLEFNGYDTAQVMIFEGV